MENQWSSPARSSFHNQNYARDFGGFENSGASFDASSYRPSSDTSSTAAYRTSNGHSNYSGSRVADIAVANGSGPLYSRQSSMGNSGSLYARQNRQSRIGTTGPFNRISVTYDDDWTNSSVRDIRRPDGQAQPRTSADVRRDSYVRRKSTVATRSAVTAARQYSSDKRASALRGDRILVDDDSLRMDKVTPVRKSGSTVPDDRIRTIQERADEYKEPRRTPAQIAARNTYKDSNIYSRNKTGKPVYASHGRTRQWTSPRKEQMRRPWIRLAMVVVSAAVLILMVSCILH